MYLLALLLVCAAVVDLRTRRVPNALVVTGLAAALGAATLAGGAGPMALALGGALVGLLALLPFYVRGAMGAGDVKLLAMAGAFLGPLPALWAALYSLAAGLVGALVVLLRHGALGALARRYGAMALMLASGHPAYLRPGVDESAAGARFPYALAICAGALLAAAGHGMNGGGAWLP